MSGIKVVLDSNVIILMSKGRIDTDKLLEEYDEFWVSVITLMEVYGYDFENQEEKDIIDDFFANIEIMDVDVRIAEKVIEYRKRNNKKIKLPDAIILATASALKAELLSGDWDDFQGFDAQVVLRDLTGLQK